MRASSHGHHQGCKLAACRNTWITGAGWTRVSRGSHAGHIPVSRSPRPRIRPDGPRLVPRRGDTAVVPGPGGDERTSTAEGRGLIPLETLDKLRYRALDDDVEPPWEKEVYLDPEGGDRS